MKYIPFSIYIFRHFVYNIAMKCVFFYNPNSGRGKIVKKLEYIEKRLRTAYDEVLVCATKSAEDLQEKVFEYSLVYDAIIFSGGDGTFNRILGGLKGRRIPLGYIPSGTVNDVARSLRIPRNVKGALNVILEGRSEALDSMKINGEHYAIYIVAAGAFTSATYETSQRFKRALGKLAYAIRVVKKNLKLQIFHITAEAEGKKIETDAVLALVMNGKTVAGFGVNKKSSMSDGMLEIALIKQVKKPNIFQKIAKFFSLAWLFLLGYGIKKKDLCYLRGEKVTFSAGEEVVWDFDGEEGVRGDVTVEAVPKSVQLFVPKTKYQV